MGLIVGLFIGKGGEGIILLSHLIGGTNEKISIRFRSNASWCGIDVCTHERGGESRSKTGKHVIRTLFANGGHVPYNPAITSTVIVTVK